jgi:hypothetical protein
MVWWGVQAFAGDAAPAGAAGMRVYVDPQTGDFLSEGPPLALPAPQSPPSAEEDSPVDGKMIRLNGQFLSAVVARIAPDGSQRLECVTTDRASLSPGGH